LRSYGYGLSENREFSKPVTEPTERAQMGAAWRASVTGASRCLGAGRVESAPLLFSNSHNKTTDQYGPIHDVIFLYTKSENFIFHPGKRPFSKGYIETRFKYRDKHGIYQPNYLTGPGTRRGDSGKPWRGFDPTKAGRHWAIPSKTIEFLGEDMSGKTTQEILDACLEADLLVIPKKEGGQPMYRQYITEGVPYQDLWAYQPNTSGVLYQSDECIDEDVKWLEQEDEKIGYDTQKPEGLLNRILETSSNENSLVADFFGGSGTTAAVRKNLDAAGLLPISANRPA
jgi:adenine specific DNA methylase Mod